MEKKLKLPVGIDGFEKIRRNGFYYIDKTKLIEQLFLNWGEVNLFTRPRRFGKTLNMSMLKSFSKSERIHHCLMGCIFLRIRNCASSIRGSIQSFFFL